MSYFLVESKSIELIRYQMPFDINLLKENHLAFSGILKQHPHDENKIILVSEPYSGNTSYYEFEKSDIGMIEKLPNIVNSDGEDLAMVLVWIKKGAIGIRSSLFVVESISSQMKLERDSSL